MIKRIVGTTVEYNWESEQYLNKPYAGEFLDIIEETGILPFLSDQIFFHDDIWDFSRVIYLNVRKDMVRFPFDGTPLTFRVILKKYIIMCILQANKKLQSIHIHFSQLNIFFKYISEHDVVDIEELPSSILQAYLDEFEGLSKSYRRAKRIVIKSFYTFYSTYYTDILTGSVESILDDKQLTLSGNEKLCRKTPDIPGEYYDALLKTALHLVEMKSAPRMNVAAACMVLLLSQTGLRVSELLELRCGCIKEKAVYGKKKLYYLEYRTWKREQGNNVFKIEQTFANQLVVLGYETLLSLYEKERREQQTEYLFLGQQTREGGYLIPVSRDRFSYYMKCFYIYVDRFFQTINLPEAKRKNLHTCNIKRNRLAREQNKNAEIVTYPSSTQYRVHACTELYAKGIPLAYIKKFMGHLTNEMTGYYVRTETYNKQEDEAYAKEILSNILSGTEKIMGADASALQNRLQTFMAEEGIYVEEDLEKVIDKLSGKMPIRQKAGGVCIRSSMERECSMDARTNEFYCAYGVCPNLFHFYHMADVSYKQALELWKGILYNEKAGFKRQAYKDLGMLHTLIRQKLLPEILELKEEISEKGKDHVLRKYPTLEEIVGDLGRIEGEIILWNDYKV